MLVIGLTGGIGCGKSLISDLFHNRFSIPVIDADTISKNLSNTKQVINAIVAELGQEFVDENFQLRRKKLKKAVFTDTKKKLKLENILHPLVYQNIRSELAELDHTYCIVSIPLLLEKNRTEFLDRVLVVDCTIEEQIERVIKRDQCNRVLVESIISSQIDRSSRLALANDVIVNSGTIQSLEEKVVSLHHKYLQLSKAESNRE